MATKAEILCATEPLAREERVHSAFYRGDQLTLQNPAYLRSFRGIIGELLRQDTQSGDVTVEAMGISNERCAVEICAKEGGVVAGIAEAAWLYEQAGLKAERCAEDGDFVKQNDILIRASGDSGPLLLLERTVVNLLQRMSGIATLTRRFVELARAANRNAHVVATRKTLWGLLDKRAVHCGGGGTHRLNLSDAVLIKTNHLRLASNSAEAFNSAIERAWKNRGQARFFEVEAATPVEALKFARLLTSLQNEDASCRCVLMLDNFSPTMAKSTGAALRESTLHDSVLVEASGNISEGSVADYAAACVDAISVGALTHSARALDLSAKLICESR